MKRLCVIAIIVSLVPLIAAPTADAGWTWDEFIDLGTSQPALIALP